MTRIKTSNGINWYEWFYCDDESKTGLRWNVEIRHGKNYNKVLRKVGDVAGGYSGKKDGGFRVKILGQYFAVSRIVFEMLCKVRLHSNQLVDHIDGDRSNNNIKNLRIVSVSENNRNVKKAHDNTSGVVGINLQITNGFRNWVSTVYKLEGGRIRKSFSVNKYGEYQAFLLACEHREQMIKNLNAQGAGYTERHGK